MEIRNKDILIVGTHCDDIEIGMSEYLAYLSRPEFDNNIKIIICSSGSYAHKLKDFNRYHSRLEAAKENLKKYTPIIFDPAIDTQFYDHYQDLKTFLEINVKEAFPQGPDIIIGPNADQHKDHQIIKEHLDIIARPLNGVRGYLMYKIPSSSIYSDMYSNNRPMSVFNFGYPDFKNKNNMLKPYTKSVLDKKGSLNAIEGIKTTNQFWGRAINMPFAEQFEIGFWNEYTFTPSTEE